MTIRVLSDLCGGGLHTGTDRLYVTDGTSGRTVHSGPGTAVDDEPASLFHVKHLRKPGADRPSNAGA